MLISHPKETTVTIASTSSPLLRNNTETLNRRLPESTVPHRNDTGTTNFHRLHRLRRSPDSTGKLDPYHRRNTSNDCIRGFGDSDSCNAHAIVLESVNRFKSRAHPTDFINQLHNLRFLPTNSNYDKSYERAPTNSPTRRSIDG